MLGVTAILTRVGVGATQVSCVLPTMLLNDAVTVTVPAVAHLMFSVVVSDTRVATEAFETDQSEVVVRSLVELSEYFPVAM